MSAPLSRPATGPPPRALWGLGLLFGAMYFAQGIAEPTEGLIAQPVISLLDSWRYTRREITLFVGLLALPWSLKPLYGLLSDFVPLAGYRRKSYLVLFSAAAAGGLAVLAAVPLPAGAHVALLALLLLPTLGVAFCDVVIDALMVEQGQQFGLTGRLQAIGWGSMYAATLLAGSLGGRLSEHGLAAGFLICAVFLGFTMLLSGFAVREPRDTQRRADFRQAARQLRQALGARGMAPFAALLFLWSFNPFSTAVLQMHVTKELGLGRAFYGDMVSISAIGSIAACLLYGFLSRRVSRLRLVHAAIILGIAGNLVYLFLQGPASAVWISAVTGFFYMVATLIQFDLAAQVCPTRAAGTAFAVLMAVSNLSTSLAISLGGYWVDAWREAPPSFLGNAAWDGRRAFQALVIAGALLTATCWFVVPFIRRSLGKP